MTEIDPLFKEMMNDLAGFLDQMFNGDLRGGDRKNAFVLLVMPFNGPPGARTNYISNAKRESIIEMMEEVVARFKKTGGIDTP
jgi:hypothetical protein